MGEDASWMTQRCSNGHKISNMKPHVEQIGFGLAVDCFSLALVHGSLS